MSEKLKASLVRILEKGRDVAIGVGFLISEKHVLTCAHVVADALGLSSTTPELPADSIHLEFPFAAKGKILKAQVVFRLPAQVETSQVREDGEDIAILELEQPPPRTTQPVNLVRSDDLWGHPFRVFGFPAEYDKGVWASGVLRDVHIGGWVQLEDVKGPGYSVIQGFSGTPVWDDELHGAVGMVVASDKQTSIKAAYFIPTAQLVKAWPLLRVQTIPPCPYRGLFAFREQDAPIFFGRERLTELLVSSLQQRSFVVLIGASGSGKSSLLFAGIIPYLRQKGDWQIISLRPGAHPFHAVASSLLPLLEPTLSEIDRLSEINKLAERLQQREIELPHVVERIIQKYPGTHLLLAADQFEELYTLCHSAGERQSFLDMLHTVIQQSLSSSHISKVKLVITLRADFLSSMLSYRPFADALQQSTLTIGPMARQEQQEMIEKPAQKLNVKMEDGLAERILAEVEREPGSLPLLEFALTQLWAKQKDGRLTHVAYQEIGGVEQALAVYAEEVYKQFSEEERQQVQQVFIQLIQPGKGTEDVRRVATRNAP